MNNIHSHTLLAPEGWTVQGGLVRTGTMLYNMPVVMDVKVTAPDGRRARIMPALSFEFFPSHEARPWQPLQSGNLFMPLPQSAGQWVLEQARLNPEEGVTDIELVGETVEEGLTAQLRQQAAPIYQIVAQTNQIGASTGMGAAFDTQAQTVTLRYRQGQQAMQETYLICWQANLTLMQGQVHSGTWSISLMVGVRDKVGGDPVNDPQLQAIFQSLRATPAWQAEMNRYWAELARIRQRGNEVARRESAKRSAIISQTHSEISDIISTGWKNRQASNDRIHQKTIDAIHEVTPYRTPAGETVKLPSYYNHVYTDGQGRYLLNNNTHYNPNLDPNLNNRSWQQIQQAQ